MLFLFPHDYFNHKDPEDLYALEYAVAKEYGCPILLLDFDVILAGGDPFPNIIPENDATCVWRGWQMPSDVYTCFVENAAAHGLHMLTTAEEYQIAHELEFSYQLCSVRAVPTKFVDTDDVSASMVSDVFTELGCPTLFVKDTVKGAYDHPCRLDEDYPENWQSELDRLFNDRGNSLADTIVFREWNELSGETRFFIVDGVPCCAQRHSEGDGSVSIDECRQVLVDTGISLFSPFFSLDLARTSDGGVVVVETGDGQVSECLPECQEELIAILSDMEL